MSLGGVNVSFRFVIVSFGDVIVSLDDVILALKLTQFSRSRQTEQNISGI